MGALRAFTRGLAVVKTIILARILLPAQFGVYGIATVVLGFFETLTETGINVFLVQKKEGIAKYVNSAWVVSIIRGVLISLIILLLIPLITLFFNSPEAKTILYLTSLVPFIRGFINPACIKYQKSLEFKKQFFYDSSLFFLDFVIAVTLGFLTKSENALIISMIITALVEVVVSYIIFDPKPKLKLNKSRFLEIIGTGKWITGASIANYIFENVDDMFVGRLLNTNALGIYQQGYKIASLPSSEVGEVFNKVTFPVYVAIGEDVKRIKRAFLKTLGIITFFVTIYGFIVFNYSDKIVYYLLGPNWYDAIPVLQVLSIYGVVKAISNSFFSLFLGLKRESIVTFTSIVRAVVLVASIYPFIKIFGILGAGFSAILAAVVSLPFFIYFAWINLK